MSKTVLDRNSYDSAVSDNDWVLLDFWATWCGPCKTMSPVFDDIADEREGKVFAAKVDVDQFGELAKQFGVRGVPTLALLHRGEVIDQLVGAHPKSKVDAWLDAQLSS